jgi:hypothetical protein
MNRVTVRHTDDRGIATLAGVVVSIVLTRLWLAGDLSDWIGMLFRSVRGEDGMSSVSYALVAFIADLVYGIGTAAVLVWSGIWWLINDVVDGWRRWRAGEPTVVIDEHGREAEPGPEPEDVVLRILQTVVANIESLQAQVDELAAKPAARRAPARRTTASK